MQSSSEVPLISVVVPVKNGQATIKSCLQGILSQSLRNELEIILIDSGSQDRTVEIASKYPVTIHHIPPQEFNHGGTRNLGVQLARGQFVVMTVQDATPADNRWLERVLLHFKDERVAGVCGLQAVPHDKDKNPMQWTRLVSEPQARKVYFSNKEDFEQLSPDRQHAHCRWDNVNAMYRRSVLKEIPFQRTAFAEDALWARDALLKGYALIYDAQAKVYHYHHEPFSFRFKRTYTVLYHTYRNFHYLKSPQPLIYAIARCVYRLGKEKGLSLSDRARWLGYNLQLIFAGWFADHLFRFLYTVRGDKGIGQAHQFFCKKPPQSTKSVMPILQ